MRSFQSTYKNIVEHVGAFTADLSSLFLRLIAAKVFLDSGLTKWNGWFQFNASKYDLFKYEYFCPDPPREGALQLCDPQTLDYVDGSTIESVVNGLALSAGIMEVLFPVLLIAGLFTRFAALALIGMTLFIQLLIFPTWSHWINPASWWAVVLFAVFAFGPGRLSLDRLFGLDKGNKSA
ncbi:DoxX family protein [Arenicella sp.]|nr:DoxX family protein [Arenicella sp.]